MLMLMLNPLVLGPVFTLLVPAWVLPWPADFLPQSKHMRVRQLATKNCLEVWVEMVVCVSAWPCNKLVTCPGCDCLALLHHCASPPSGCSAVEAVIENWMGGYKVAYFQLWECSLFQNENHNQVSLPNMWNRTWNLTSVFLIQSQKQGQARESEE